MSTHSSPHGRTIALDADGVLLDYSGAYANAWAKAFGERPALRDPEAYWPIDRWVVERLQGRHLAVFRSAFDEEFWLTIPAIPGAIDVCRQLVEAGYRLICITTLDEAFVTARRLNLERLGFPITEVIVTGGQDDVTSSKAAVVAKLQLPRSSMTTCLITAASRLRCIRR